jgi:hypothetical protein
MNGPDEEVERLRMGVSCATLLEKMAPGWALDRRESTKRCLKYRRGEEVVIVNHDGRGWWDPKSTAKGDVFNLVQHLDGSLNFGEVRKILRPFVGISPVFPEMLREHRRDRPDLPIAERWSQRPKLQRNSRAWRYLTEIRHLPPAILLQAITADVVREGFYGSGWFAHRDDDGAVSHIEVRGPDFKGSLRGGTKVLFRFGAAAEPPRRMAVAEAPIDALSLAAIDDLRSDTIYLATDGGMGPSTLSAIRGGLAAIVATGGGVLCSAVDANTAGERYAVQHFKLAEAAGISFERLRPPIPGGDWNEVLKQRKVK